MHIDDLIGTPIKHAIDVVAIEMDDFLMVTRNEAIQGNKVIVIMEIPSSMDHYDEAMCGSDTPHAAILRRSTFYR